MPSESLPAAVMTCGLPGSGKTTLARRLEIELGAVRLDVDLWMVTLFGQSLTPADQHAKLILVKDLLWEEAKRLLELDVSIVLDFGFWKRAERLDFARRVRAAGGRPILHFMDPPVEVLEKRLAARNANLPQGTYEITPEMFAEFVGRFETPSDDEGLEIVRYDR